MDENTKLSIPAGLEYSIIDDEVVIFSSCGRFVHFLGREESVVFLSFSSEETPQNVLQRISKFNETFCEIELGEFMSFVNSLVELGLLVV